jgi:flavin-dependent dehydrogenase
VAAALLARRGWHVLLVEKCAWPREKACGGCLNTAGVVMLKIVGMGTALKGAAPLTMMRIHQGRRQLDIPLPPGVVVQRSQFDANLVKLAMDEGATFRPETLARLMPATDKGPRQVRLRQGNTWKVVDSHMVLACDGLGGSFLADEPWAQAVPASSGRLGFAATLPGNDRPRGVLDMVIGAEGYIGIEGLAEDKTHIGAALLPAACHARGGPMGVIEDILADCGLTLRPAVGGLKTAHWRGTGPLTMRRRAVAGSRVLVIGDACGFVEPFTGEGMSWAIRGAWAAVELLPDRAEDWDEGLIQAWQQRHEATVGQRQRWCRRLCAVLGWPALVGRVMAAAHWWPGMTSRIAHRICV